MLSAVARIEDSALQVRSRLLHVAAAIRRGVG